MAHTVAMAERPVDREEIDELSVYDLRIIVLALSRSFPRIVRAMIRKRQQARQGHQDIKVLAWRLGDAEPCELVSD